VIAMSNRVAAMVSLFLLAATGCSRSHSSGGAGGAVEQPWSHAWSGDPNGWWTSWKLEKAPFPEGTRFEFETIEMDGSRGTSAWVARSPTPGPGGMFWIEFTGDDGSSQRLIAPPPLPSSAGPILSRNEKLVSVTTPAGTFLAGRLWRSDRYDDIHYETDEWLAPGISFPVQTWSRPVSEKQLYDPPLEGSIPSGTRLRRLIRMQKP
jgi:hypothetical protein